MHKFIHEYVHARIGKEVQRFKGSILSDWRLCGIYAKRDDEVGNLQLQQNEEKEISEMFHTWIDLERLKNSLNKKSPGPDGLKPVIFQYLPENVLTFVLLIYKSCIALEFTPKVWSVSIFGQI